MRENIAVGERIIMHIFNNNTIHHHGQLLVLNIPKEQEK